MSSITGAILTSDNVDSDSVAGLRSRGSQQRYSRNRSSSRPRGPPSESAAAQSDDEGFADDRVVGARGDSRRPKNPFDRAVPRVVDSVGEVVQQRFEDFLEQ